jgi:hypothetical protein
METIDKKASAVPDTWQWILLHTGEMCLGRHDAQPMDGAPGGTTRKRWYADGHTDGYNQAMHEMGEFLSFFLDEEHEARLQSLRHPEPEPKPAPNPYRGRNE